MRLNLIGAAVVTVVAIAGTSRAGSVGNVELVGTWDGFAGSYADVWADGTHAYLGHFGSASIDIVDISSPASPSLAAAYVLPPPNTSSSAQDVKVADGLLFIALEGGGNSCHIVDVRDPPNPVPLVDVAISGFTGIHNVFFDNGFLYMADSNTPRVGIVDLRGLNPDIPPASPITATYWMLENVGSSIVHDITVVDGRMYASAWDSGIWIYDVTNVATQPPGFLGSAPGNNTHSCWPTADGQYVITGEERTGGGITVYRMTDSGAFPPLTVTVTDSVAVPTTEASSVHNQAVVGFRVYNSWYGAGLRVYDVDPVSGLLTLAATYDPAQLNSAWGVDPFLGPDRVLVSDISNGLFVLDVTTRRPGDVDGDGLVTVSDLLDLLAAWGPCPAPCTPGVPEVPDTCPTDTNRDCQTDVADLLTVLAHWD